VQRARQLYRWCGKPPASVGQLQSKKLFCWPTLVTFALARSRHANRLMGKTHCTSSAPNPQEKVDMYLADVALHCVKCTLEMELFCKVACAESEGSLCFLSPPLQQYCNRVVHHKFRYSFVFSRAFLYPYPGYVSYISNPIINCALLSILTNSS